ncbi:MAG: hypothetical protein AB1758_03375 [Candidatus Eremiobacterota bacterium]
MQVYLRNDHLANSQAFVDLLSRAVDKHRSAEFKAFVLLMPEDPAVEKLKPPQSDNVGIALLKGVGAEALELYKINPEVRNTVIVYRDRKVSETFVNLDVSRDGARLEKAIVGVCK